MRIVLPPVQRDLLCLIHRTNQQPNPNREQLHISERDANIPRNHQAFIQHPIQDVQQVGSSGYARRTFHKLIFLYLTKGRLTKAKKDATGCFARCQCHNRASFCGRPSINAADSKVSCTVGLNSQFISYRVPCCYSKTDYAIAAMLNLPYFGSKFPRGPKFIFKSLGVSPKWSASSWIFA